jgi:hypothetical protein
LVTTIEPLTSPDPAGTTALTVTVADCPGRSLTRDGVTDPKGPGVDTDAPNRTVPVVPFADDAELMTIAVHVPGDGRRTDALPYPLTPCGSDCPASRPSGSIRSNRTRPARELADAGVTG